MRKEIVSLADGRELVIRPINRLDAGPIAESFHLLHEDELRRRFLHIPKELGEEHLRRLTQPAPGREFVVVAAEQLPPGDALVGAVARLSCDLEDGSRAEFGLLVSHFVTGLGLGRRLMGRLVEWSIQHQVSELWGDVMDDNTVMLDLAGKLGFRKEAITGSPGLVRIRLQVGAAGHQGSR
jgi:GNAT superfamily N-acetyltransferase